MKIGWSASIKSYQLVERLKLVRRIFYEYDFSHWNNLTQWHDHLPMIFTYFSGSESKIKDYYIKSAIHNVPNKDSNIFINWLANMYVFIWESFSPLPGQRSHTEQKIFEKLRNAGENIGFSNWGFKSPNKRGIYYQEDYYRSDDIVPPSYNTWYQEMMKTLLKPYSNQEGGHNGRRRSSRHRRRGRTYIQRITKRKSRRTRRCH